MARAAQGVQRPAGPDAARSGARNPRQIPAGWGRHHRNRLVQRQRRIAGRLRTGGVCLRNVASGGGRGPQRGRRIHGPQPAETPLRGGFDGAHQPHGLDVGRRGEPRGPRSDFRTTRRSLHRSGAGTAGRRSRHPAGRDHLRHAQRQGGPLRDRRAGRKTRPHDPRHGVGHAGRRQRPHPVGTDRRGLLHLAVARAAALPRPELRLRSQTAAALPRTAGRNGPVPHLGAPQRRTSQRHGRLRRDPGDVRRGRGRIHAPRTGQYRRRMLRHDARAYLRTFENRLQLCPAPRSGAAPRHDAERTGAAAHRARNQFRQRRRAHQRRRLGQIRPPDPRGQLRRGPVGSPCAGRCGGADRRRLHGRRHDRRRRSHAHIPQPDGLGAGNRPRADDDRLLEMGGARGGSGGHAGQGRGQFDLAQGGRSRIPAPRTGDTPLRSRRGGDALRRAGTGRHLRAQDRGGLTRLPPADRRGIPRRRHHLRPQHTGRGDGNSRTRRLRQSLYRRDALDQGKPALRKGVGRRVEPLVRLPRQQRRARSDALGVPLPRHPRGHGHGHRQPANGEDIQRDRTRTAPTRRGRDPLPPGRRRRTAHRICAAGAHHGRNPAAGPRRMARGNARRADRPRHAQGRSGLHRAGRAGGLRSPRNADGRDRHPADARHGAGRHALRRG